MPEHATSARSPRHRLGQELRAFALLTAYLFVCFAALNFFKAAVLQAQGVAFAPWLLSLGKAAIAAKFMLLGRLLGVGDRRRPRRLVWVTLYRALAFLLLLILLTLVEELVLGLIHGHSLAQSLAGFGGGTAMQRVATAVILLLVLIPYFAFQALDDALGEGTLTRLFLARRDGAGNSPASSGGAPTKAS